MAYELDGEEVQIIYPDGYSPTIVDCDGIPAAIRAVLESRADVFSLIALYALIDKWADEQREFAKASVLSTVTPYSSTVDAMPPTPLGWRREALATVTLGGIDGGELGDIDIEQIASKRLEEIQRHLVHSDATVYLTLYGDVPPPTSD